MNFDHSPQVGLKLAKCIVFYHTMDPSSAAWARNLPKLPVLPGLRKLNLLEQYGDPDPYEEAL